MPKALLFVTMEPPSGLEDEFNDWYDTEHFPQRRALPGFESASRWVCLVGWPRWLALYDMTGVEAVETPQYRAVSGANGTPWTRRLLPRTIGRERLVGVQAEPGDALGRPTAEVATLVAARYPRCAPGAARAASEIAGLLQARRFTVEGQDILLAEYERPVAHGRVLQHLAEVEGVPARSVNLYAPYLRGPGA